MRTIAFTILVLLVACEAPPPAALPGRIVDGTTCAPRSPQVIAEMEADLAALLDEEDIPGATWAVVECGSVQHVGAVGTDPGGAPMSEDTILPFKVQRLGIGLTAAAAAARGLVDLDATIDRYLPDAAELAPGPAPTLLQLLTDTAGLPGGFHDDCDEDGGTLREFLSRAAVARWFAPGELPPVRSDVGGVLAALVLEAVLQRPYPELLAELVLRPHAIAASAEPPFEPPGRPPTCPVVQTVILHTDARALAQLVTLLIEDGPVFHGESRRALVEAVPAFYPSFARGLAAVWGVGPWRGDVRAGTQYFSSGTEGAFGFSPEGRLAIVVLVNGGTPRPPSIGQRFVGLQLERLLGPRSNPPASLPPLEDHEGTFASRDGSLVREFRVLDGQLRAITAWDDTPLVAGGYGARDPTFAGLLEPDLFHAPDGRFTHFRFVRGADGRVVAVALESAYGPGPPFFRIE